MVYLELVADFRHFIEVLTQKYCPKTVQFIVHDNAAIKKSRNRFKASREKTALENFFSCFTVVKLKSISMSTRIHKNCQDDHDHEHERMHALCAGGS